MSESLLAEALKRFDQAKSREEENREAFKEAKAFYSGEQWPEKVKQARERAGLPVLTFNFLPQFVNQVVNDIRKNPPQIKVRPVDSAADVQTATMYGGLIRNIEDQSNASMEYETAAKYAAIGGWGVLRVCYDYYGMTFYPELRIESCDPEMVLCGPYKKADASDAEYWFVERLTDRDEWERTLKDVADFDESLKKANDAWKQDDKVLICEYWYKKPKKMRLALMPDGSVIDATDKEELEGAAIREFMGHEIRRATLASHKVLRDEAWPSSKMPFAMVIGEEIEVDDKPVRYGLVKPGMDAQRQLNYQKSKATERITLTSKAPWIVHEDAVQGLEGIWGRANLDAQAYLPWKGEIPPQQTIPPGPSVGEIQLAESAANDLYAITGIRPASMDEQKSQASGDAIRLKQRESNTSTFNYPDNLARGVAAIGRVLIDMIPRVYTTAQWVRIKGEDQNTQLVQLNTPYIDGGKEVLYDTSKGQYDITVTVGPAFATQREETANALVEIMRSAPESSGVLGAEVVKLFDFSNAAVIGQKLEQAMQQKQGAPDPMAQAMQVEAMKSAETIKVKQATAQAEMQLHREKFELEKAMAIFEDQRKREQMQFEANLQVQVEQTKAELKLREIEANVDLKHSEAMLRVRERQASVLPGEMSDDLMSGRDPMQELTAALMAMAQTMQASLENQTNTTAQIVAAITADRIPVRDQSGNLIGSKVVLN